MPNAFDDFEIQGLADPVLASISVDSNHTFMSYRADTDFVTPFTYDPGFKPPATELGFASYDTREERNVAREASDSETGEPFAFGTTSSTAPTATITPSATALDTSPGEHSGQIAGHIPNVSDNTTWYALLGIRQAALDPNYVEPSN